MKTLLLVLTCVFGIIDPAIGQTKQATPSVPVWSDADRKFLLDNLTGSRDAIIAETKNLSKAQWNFKESPDRWSINQIIEHLCLEEVISLRGIATSLQIGPMPDFQYYMADSVFADPDPKVLHPNVTTDYTKPFSITVPLGNNDLKNNLIWFTKMEDEAIEHVKTETKNLRVNYFCFGPNIHQQYMGVFRHTFRHLVQIRKVKSDPKYPKK